MYQPSLQQAVAKLTICSHTASQALGQQHRWAVLQLEWVFDADREKTTSQIRLSATFVTWPDVLVAEFLRVLERRYTFCRPSSNQVSNNS
jgi:hypothetical protein